MENECRLGMLCASEHTTFLFRGEEPNDSDTLYISPTYSAEDAPAYAVYCWFSVAFNDDIKLEDIKVLKSDDTWWSPEACAPWVKSGVVRE